MLALVTVTMLLAMKHYKTYQNRQQFQRLMMNLLALALVVVAVELLLLLSMMAVAVELLLMKFLAMNHCNND